MIVRIFFIACLAGFFPIIVYPQQTTIPAPDSLPKRNLVVTFRLDPTAELKNVQSLASIGIRGNAPPLSWNKTYTMKGKKTGIYEATIPFETFDPVFRITYKYFHDTSSWERSNNRVLLIKDATTLLPVDQWNTVAPANSQAYHDSMEAVELYNTVIALDSLLFTTYNICDLERHAALFAEDVEFYHDKGGLSIGRKALVEAVKNNICGKVRRDLVKGSIEVSPIPGYGAVETGEHRFYNIKEQSLSQPGKFTMIWRKKNGNWEITRVISLH